MPNILSMFLVIIFVFLRLKITTWVTSTVFWSSLSDIECGGCISVSSCHPLSEVHHIYRLYYYCVRFLITIIFTQSSSKRFPVPVPLIFVSHQPILVHRIGSYALFSLLQLLYIKILRPLLPQYALCAYTSFYCWILVPLFVLARHVFTFDGSMLYFIHLYSLYSVIRSF